MKNSTVILLAAFAGTILFLSPPLLHADVQVYINGSAAPGVSPGDILERSYEVPFRRPYTRGVTLLETLPLFLEVYRIEVEYGGPEPAGRAALEGENWADRFGGWYFSADGDEVHLLTGEAAYRDVRKLRLWGEEIPGRRLTVWIGWEGVKELKEELARFAGTGGLDLDVQEVPHISSKLTSVARGGGNIPDLVMVQSDYLPELIKAGVLQRLDYLGPENLLGKGTDAFRRENSLWALPFSFDTQLVFYRTDIVDDPPSNDWDLGEFEAALERLRVRGISPITWNAYSAYWFIPFQTGFGKTSILEKDGTVVIDDEPTRKALGYILELAERGLLDIQEREGMMGRFLSGEVGMILSGSYSIPEFERLEIPFGILPYPNVEETGKPVSPLLDFKGFAITRRTRNPVLARRVAEYLTGVGVQQRFHPRVSKLPANTEAWVIMKEKNRYYDTLYRSYTIGSVIPPEDSYRLYKNTMWKLIRFALTGQLTVEETLKQGQQIIDNTQQARR